MTSFTKKKIEVTLQLQNNTTFDTGGNTLHLSGYRVECEARNIGMMGSGSTAKVKIYGMSLNDMNKMTVTQWQNLTVSKNLITVMAGDDSNMSMAFDGEITQAWSDLSGTPDTCLTIDANLAFSQQVTPAEGTATQAQTPVADMMKDLATKMGYGFENNGVDGTLSAMTLKGSYIDQAKTVASASNILWTIENKVLIIAPMGQPIRKGQIPLLNEQTGLLGYPSISSKGVSIVCLYNPAINFYDLIKIETPIKPAEGEWIVSSLSYRLESEKANGAWYCQIEAIRPQNAVGEANNTGGDDVEQ